MQEKIYASNWKKTFTISKYNQNINTLLLIFRLDLKFLSQYETTLSYG